MLFYVHSRDVIIITSIDTLTSLLGGLTIFSILGNVIYEMRTEDISSNVRLGTGLGFVSYPDGFAKFDAVPQVSDILCILVK
jgi:solute carrier family 6 amino acid transporter-like protein 5/7/9/14